MLDHCLKEFERGRAEGTPVSQVDNPQKAIWTFLHCTETREEAIASRAAEAAMWYVNAFPKLFKTDRKMWMDMIRGGPAATRAVVSVDDPMAGIDPNDPHPLVRLMNRQALGMEVDPEEAFDALNAIETVLIGDVDTLRKKLEGFKGIGADRVLGLQQFGGLSHESVMRSIKLAGEHLIPAIA
jgi:alkanesulfonate monooxygenase SsuD/methylene tetrahydromethanopterin reductase-like flavin-dependent oxidoreductase (luciferase family)